MQLSSNMRQLTTVLCLVLVGCVGTIEQDYNVDPNEPGAPAEPGGDGQDLAAAKQLFDTNVFPIMTARCAGCHLESAQAASPARFVAADLANGWQMATSFAALVGSFAPSAAPILTKIKPSHQGLTYTADEETKITAWLAKEVELRSAAPTTPPPDPVTPPSAVACDNPITTTASGRHNPGRACLTCHSAAGGETPFTVGGTLYKGVNGTTPIAGATIHLVDANGKDIPLVTALNGNFWSTQPIVFPVSVRASRCPDTKAMSAPVTAAGGNCNMGGCHTATLPIYLP